MPLDAAHNRKLGEIVQFENRIHDAYERLPYLEDLVEAGESIVAEEMQEVFDIYQASLLVIVRVLAADPTGQSITDAVIDEAYTKLYGAEKKLYEDITEFVLHDLKDRWRHSLAKSVEAYQKVRRVERTASDLKAANLNDVSDLSKQYYGLLSDCDEIDALIIGSEARSRAVRTWQIVTGILVATIGALITRLMGLW